MELVGLYWIKKVFQLRQWGQGYFPLDVKILDRGKESCLKKHIKDLKEQHDLDTREHGNEKLKC